MNIQEREVFMLTLLTQVAHLNLTAGDINRLRSWGVLAREQTGGEDPAWSEDDMKLLSYLEDTLIETNQRVEGYNWI
ncbi:hypothetical protein U2E29_17215 [Acinetobacter baumannii]|uniref:hypothetical protein n=1 Tax=Acinetobacter baumannii TaxID=470 RepID=UPI00338F1A21